MKKKRRFNWVFYGLVIYVAACFGLIFYVKTHPITIELSEYDDTEYDEQEVFQPTEPTNKLLYRRIVRYVNKNEDMLLDNYTGDSTYVYFIYEQSGGCDLCVYYGFCYSENKITTVYHRGKIYKIESGKCRVADDSTFDFYGDHFVVYFQNIKDNWYYFEFRLS